MRPGFINSFRPRVTVSIPIVPQVWDFRREAQALDGWSVFGSPTGFFTGSGGALSANLNVISARPFFVGNQGLQISGLQLLGSGAALSAGDAAFVVATAAASTIAVGSNGQVLPQATINVVSTAAFTSTGSLFVTTSAGSQTVTYTGKTATSFTGCSGGTGTMTTGGAVTQKGIGYCVKGTGTFLYAQNTFSNSAAVAYNVRVQNTVTALPVATTFTPTA